jgi:hypothetical protein
LCRLCDLVLLVWHFGHVACAYSFGKSVLMAAYCAALSVASNCAFVALRHCWPRLVVLASYIATCAIPPVIAVSQLMVGIGLVGGVRKGDNIACGGLWATLGGGAIGSTLRCGTAVDTKLGSMYGFTLGSGTMLSRRHWE